MMIELELGTGTMKDIQTGQLGGEATYVAVRG